VPSGGGEPREHEIPRDRRARVRQRLHRELRRHRARHGGEKILIAAARLERRLRAHPAHGERVNPAREGAADRPPLALKKNLADHPAALELVADSVLRARRPEPRLAEEVADQPAKRGLSRRVAGEPIRRRIALRARHGGGRPEDVEPAPQADVLDHRVLGDARLAQDQEASDPEGRLGAGGVRAKRRLFRGKEGELFHVALCCDLFSRVEGAGPYHGRWSREGDPRPSRAAFGRPMRDGGSGRYREYISALAAINRVAEKRDLSIEYPCILPG